MGSIEQLKAESITVERRQLMADGGQGVSSWCHDEWECRPVVFPTGELGDSCEEDCGGRFCVTRLTWGNCVSDWSEQSIYTALCGSCQCTNVLWSWVVGVALFPVKPGSKQLFKRVRVWSHGMCMGRLIEHCHKHHHSSTYSCQIRVGHNLCIYLWE